jgi:quinoprotein glucose dehydrogenase
MIRKSNGEGLGGEVGPDLTDVGARQSREYILESIVAPSRQIAQGFDTVVVATTDGKLSAGLLQGDDGKNPLLKTPQGFTLIVPKDQIEEQTRGASAMPEELARIMTRSELRDLVEFLVNQKGQGIDPQ